MILILTLRLVLSSASGVGIACAFAIKMSLIRAIYLVAFFIPMFAGASVTASWTPTDAAAAASWLSGIGGSASHQDAESFYYFSTTTSEAVADPIIANLTVWGRPRRTEYPWSWHPSIPSATLG